MPRITIPHFNPHPGQRAILRAARKRNVACMGRRYGKTHLMVDVILNQPGGALAGARGDGRRGLPCAWYAPNDSYFSKVFQGIAQQYAPLIRKASTAPRPVIEFKNGGSIDFWTLENPMKCGRGNFYARVVLDEAAHARHLKDAWEQTIEFTLADLDGDAWFISTPFGINYFTELWRRGVPDSPTYRKEWISHRAPSFDNPYLPDGWMESKRASMPERVFQQEVLAQFLESGAGVFRWHPSDHALEEQGHPTVQYSIGIDWARSNDFTVAAVIKVATGELVHIDRFTGIGFDLQTSRLKALFAKFPGAYITAESNSIGLPMIERLQADGLPVVAFMTTNSSKVLAIESLALALETGQLKVPDIDWLAAELLSYTCETLPSGAIRYSAPEGLHDDGVMALAIAWHGATSQCGNVTDYVGNLESANADW